MAVAWKNKNKIKKKSITVSTAATRAALMIMVYKYKGRPFDLDENVCCGRRETTCCRFGIRMTLLFFTAVMTVKKDVSLVKETQRELEPKVAAADSSQSFE